jgi:Na+-driven multidrug efflux pump
MGIYFSLLASCSIGFLQLAFIFLVNFVTVKFLAAQWIFIVLASYIFWESIEKFPEIILTSSRVNRQNVVMFVWGICLGLNIVLDLAAVWKGYGIVGIAAATTVTQCISAVVMYFYSSKYLFYSSEEFKSFLKKLLLPFLLPLIITITHWMALDHFDLISMITVSAVGQLVVWLIIIQAFYRDYWPTGMLRRCFSWVEERVLRSHM